ncbi:cytotoxic T-lymphocyte protein 4 [Centropristis striata]|uniref:cytotoxic T-lymphocyte protein 4 n=1 Tax=Centropristis striata TaxID=184440 RepID=UPI0027DF3117|nr:cytotoxic T-lymphocyte protein 4 [Centropristis striata]
MFLTHCVTLWMLLALQSLCLPVYSILKVVQPYRVESTNGTARVQCIIQPQPSFHHITSSESSYPHPDPEELRVTLLRGLKGNQPLCSDILNFTEQREGGEEREGEVQCSAQVREGAVEVTVSGLRPSDTDMYRCEIEVFYPPPFLRLTGNGTLIHVLGSAGCPQPQRQVAARAGEGEEEEGEERTETVPVPVLVLVILVICVLSIIVYFQAVQCQQSKREIRRMPAMFQKMDAAAFSC